MFCFSQFLTKNPRKRLGAFGDTAAIKRHPFFKRINWIALLEKWVKPPLRRHSIALIEKRVKPPLRRHSIALLEKRVMPPLGPYIIALLEKRVKPPRGPHSMDVSSSDCVFISCHKHLSVNCMLVGVVAG